MFKRDAEQLFKIYIGRMAILNEKIEQYSLINTSNARLLTEEKRRQLEKEKEKFENLAKNFPEEYLIFKMKRSV